MTFCRAENAFEKGLAGIDVEERESHEEELSESKILKPEQKSLRSINFLFKIKI